MSAIIEQTGPARPANSTLDLLLIEDEPALADSIHYSLEREGFRVVVAPDGERGEVAPE